MDLDFHREASFAARRKQYKDHHHFQQIDDRMADSFLALYLLMTIQHLM